MAKFSPLNDVKKPTSDVCNVEHVVTDNLGRTEREKKNHVCRRRQFRAERKKNEKKEKKTMSVDDDSLGRKEKKMKKKEKNHVYRRRQFRAEKKTLSIDNGSLGREKKEEKEKKENPVRQGLETSISGPGFQDFAHGCTLQQLII